MKDLFCLRPRRALTRQAEDGCTFRTPLPAGRAQLWLVLCLLAGALVMLPWSAQALGWLGGQAQAAAAAGLSLSPSSWITYPGATFSVDIIATCGANADAAAAVVTFNPTHLQVEALTPDESVFATTLLQSYDNATGMVKYDSGSLTCHAQGNCPSSTIRLATIRFRAVGECGFLVPLSVQGQVAWSGNYTFDATGTGSTISITIPGDMNADGKVDVVDIMLVAGRWPAARGDPKYDVRYDIDGSGQIDIVDIMFVAARWNTSCSRGAPHAKEAD